MHPEISAACLTNASHFDGPMTPAQLVQIVTTWAESIAAPTDEPVVDVEVKSVKPGKKQQKPRTRDMIDADVYRLVKEDGKSLEEAGIIHAAALHRDRPFFKSSVKAGVDRHEAKLAEFTGLYQKSISLNKARTAFKREV